jgi:hypothetical protein
MMDWLVGGFRSSFNHPTNERVTTGHIFFANEKSSPADTGEKGSIEFRMSNQWLFGASRNRG